MQGLVRCRGCGWVWESVAVGGYERCRCGAGGSDETMEPADGSTTPLGITINPLIVREAQT